MDLFGGIQEEGGSGANRRAVRWVSRLDSSRSESEPPVYAEGGPAATDRAGPSAILEKKSKAEGPEAGRSSKLQEPEPNQPPPA